jgi:hypothetical protein
MLNVIQINRYNEHIHISERARIFISFVAIFCIFVVHLIFAISVGRGPCVWLLVFSRRLPGITSPYVTADLLLLQRWRSLNFTRYSCVSPQSYGVGPS